MATCWPWVNNGESVKYGNELSLRGKEVRVEWVWAWYWPPGMSWKGTFWSTVISEFPSAPWVIVWIVPSSVTDRALCYQMAQAVRWLRLIVSTSGGLQAGTERERHTEGWPLSPGTPKDSLWQARGRGDCVRAGGRPNFYATVSQSVNQRASQPADRPGPGGVKQQAGRQNEPQRQCQQTTVGTTSQPRSTLPLTALHLQGGRRGAAQRGRTWGQTLGKLGRKVESEGWQEGRCAI